MARKLRVRRALRLTAIVLCCASLAYLLLANAVLAFGGVEAAVNGSTKDAHLTLGRTYTWFPGWVEVRDLKLRFEDRNVQLELVVPRASARVSLLGLFWKQLHVRSVDADGVHFLFRHKVASVVGNEKRLAHFPHIEGFSDPPLLKPEPVVDKTGYWTILVENVKAQGLELWFMEYRFAGIADVTGAFELAPGRKLWVGPAHADIPKGVLTLGGKKPLAKAVRGKLDFRFRETNPDPIVGLLIARQMSVKLVADCDLVDLEAANLYLDDGLKVTRGAGPVHARIEVLDGRLQPSSRFAYEGSEDVHVALPEAALHAHPALAISAPAASGESPRLLIEASLGSAKVALGKGESGGQRVERVDVVVERTEGRVFCDNADVAKPWKVEEASFRVAGGRVDDLGSLGRLAEPERPRLLEGGAAWFSAHAELEKGHWAGALRADGRRVLLHVGSRRLRLKTSLAASAESPVRNLENGMLRDVRVQLDDEEPLAGAKASGLEVSVRAPRIVWSHYPPGEARGEATLRAPHLEPLLEAAGAPPLLMSVTPNGPLDASARFELLPGAVDFRLDLAKSGPFRAMGRLRACSPARGAFLVKSGVFSVGLSVHGDEVSVVPIANEAWLAKNTPECSPRN